MKVNTWNKEDVQHVIDALKVQERMFYKGITFLKIPMKGPIDHLMNFIRWTCVQGMGALSQGMVRSMIESSNKVNPCPSCQMVLDSTDAKEEAVYVVSVLDVTFDKDSDAFLQFAISHEIAHVLNGDLDPENSVEPNGEEYVAREKRADLFATRLFGKDMVSKQLAIVRIDMTSEHVMKNMIKNGIATKEQIGITVAQLQLRWNYIYSLQ